MACSSCALHDFVTCETLELAGQQISEIAVVHA